MDLIHAGINDAKSSAKLCALRGRDVPGAALDKGTDQPAKGVPQPFTPLLRHGAHEF
jgi:hypothetical protein